MKLPSWMKSTGPWVAQNLPTILALVQVIAGARPVSGTMTKTRVLAVFALLGAGLGCASLGVTAHDAELIACIAACKGPCVAGPGAPYVCATPQPAPSVKPSLPPPPPPSPDPGTPPPPASPAPASPSPAPVPTPSATPPPSPCVPAPPSTPAPPLANCVRPHDPSISEDPAVCWKCSDLRGWQVAQGNWIDHKRKDGWLEDNVGSNRYVTKECDTVTPDGRPLHAREDGYLGNICPRYDAACPVLPDLHVVGPAPPCPPPSSPPPPPPSDDEACKLGPDGNYPVPPVGTCPACWRKDPGLIAYWGVAFRSKTPCSGPSCPYGVKVNVDITPHSAKPYLGHRAQGSDTWEGCQPCGDPSNPECRAAIPEIWVYPPGAEPGLCDPFSGSLYWCHHKAQAGQGGKTRFEVHAPPFRFIEVDIP